MKQKKLKEAVPDICFVPNLERLVSLLQPNNALQGAKEESIHVHEFSLKQSYRQKSEPLL